LAIESQIPKNDDYITVRLGLRPIILLRDSQGKIRALFNRCTHRGTTLCRKDKGSARILRVRITLELSQHRQSCAPCRGRTVMPATSRTPSSTSHRCARRQLSRVHLRHAQSRRASLLDYLGAITKPIDEWLDRQPRARSRCARQTEAQIQGQLEARYDNSGDGYHVVFSHRSLLEMENRPGRRRQKGMSYYKARRTSRRCHGLYGQRPPLQGQAAEHPEARRRIVGRGRPLPQAPSTTPRNCADASGARRRKILDLASSEPVNINVFPNFSLLGNHIQVFEPVSVDETNVTSYGTAVVDRGRRGWRRSRRGQRVAHAHAGAIPEFRRGRRPREFRGIQRGLAVPGGRVGHMHRGLDIPGRVKTDANGIITAPATDEAFMRRIHQRMKAADEGDAPPRGSSASRERDHADRPRPSTSPITSMSSSTRSW